MRVSVYIDGETAALLPYLRQPEESMSALVQRLIRESAGRLGYAVSTTTVVTRNGMPVK